MSNFSCCWTDCKEKFVTTIISQALKLHLRAPGRALKLVGRLKVWDHIMVIKWSIVCKAKPYSNGAMHFNLCLAKKLGILRPKHGLAQKI